MKAFEFDMWRGAAVLALAAAAVACSDPKRPPAPPVPVAVATAVQRNVPVEIAATGSVEPMQTVAVASQIGGTLTRVNFSEGENVQRGQVLFQIDPRPYEASLHQAEAVLARDRAQLASAQQDVQRYSQLVTKDYVTQQQYDQVKANAAALEGTVHADEAAVENARLNLQYATVRAPISGRAGALLVKPGNLVRANGQTLVTINQIDPIMVKFAVPAARLPAIRQHAGATMPVRAQPLGDSAAMASGTLSFIDNAVDSTTGTILLKARFDNRDGRLWPGEFVNVALQVYMESNVLTVPSQAVVQGQEGSYVFVVAPDLTARQQPVQVARSAGGLAIIHSGLAPGDRVVTDGQIRLTTGARVQIKAVQGADQPSAG
ncbi:MAG TPA: efflux RND transporter periplasmic adaptor subunit [Gemmatimonadaceae bacterium]|nr:efflux RND transporter periplasmic adaptor subunit [Gemmatimonadaceae bacterium]